MEWKSGKKKGDLIFDSFKSNMKIDRNCITGFDIINIDVWWSVGNER